METTASQPSYPFLRGGGEMGELIRQHDWSRTSIGPPAEWPQSLRTTLSILLQSKFPMFLFWGKEHLCFYNDAYRPSLGTNGKHPGSLGRSAAAVWPETWDVIKPLIDQVLAGGEATWHEDQLLPIYRNGRLEDVYWTFSYSSVCDESGTPAGVFVTCTETTRQVSTLRQLHESRDQLAFAVEATELGTWDLNPVTRKFTANARLKAWFGLLPDEELALSQATDSIAEPDRQRVADAIQTSLHYASGGQYAIDYTIIHPVTQQERIVRARGKAWFTDDQRAYRFNGTLQDITEERKAHDERAAAQQLADLAIKSAGIGLFRVELASGQINYSPSFAAIMTGDGRRKGLNRQTFDTYIQAEDQPLRAAAVKNGLETGEFDYQPRVIWADGSVHHVSIRGGVIRDENGQPIALSGTVRDITEQARQRQALNEAEIRFRSLIEEAPVATCLYVGRELTIAIANDVMLGYLGKTQAVIGQPLAVAVPELEGQPFLNILEEVFTTGKTYVARNARADLEVDGQLGTYYFDFTYKPLRNAAGEVYAIMEMAIDVTDQVLAQHKIAEAETSLRGAVKLAELATWSLDADTGLLTDSERLKTWYGFQTDETVYTTNYNPIAEPDRERVREAITRALTAGSDGVLDVDYTAIEYRTGRQRLLRTRGRTQFDAAGKPLKLVGMAQDVTEQKSRQLALEQLVQERTEALAASNEELLVTNEEMATSNDELEEANQLLTRSNQNLEQFAFVASHDLQEPLRKIQSFGDLLINQYATQLGEGVGHLHRMQHAASRMSTLIKDLLTFSRLSTRKDLIREVALSEVMQMALSDLDLRIQETGAVIDLEALPTVQGDSSQLGLLFQNLLNNALKFQRTDTPPLIQVSSRVIGAANLPTLARPTRAARAFYRIDVVDNGIGFDEKYLDRIFQVFQRLHGKNQYSGTGIGLAICAKVAANHGGAITASSQPGQGATFSVFLPF